jgi:hypothetical protein
MKIIGGIPSMCGHLNFLHFIYVNNRIIFKFNSSNFVKVARGRPE